MEIEPRCFGSGEKQKTVHKVDKVILDLFWTLAEGNDADRVQAAEKLFQRLAENKTKNPESASSQQDYCLQRLIRGLSSSRKFARVGYAVALTKLLRQMKDIKVKVVLDIISGELKVSAHDPKSEVGSKLLGRVFAYGAVIQSDRKLKGEQLSAMVSELSSVGEKKSYIRPSCTQTLVDLIERVPQEVLREGVWPLLRGQLDKGWEDCTPDRLLLLLACRRRDKSLVDKAYLKTHWGAAKLMGKKNQEHLLHLFRRSIESPQLQPALLEAVAMEVTQKASDIEELKEFWTKVGNPLLASTVLRKQVAMSLFCQLLERTSDLTLAQHMLFPAVASVICKTADKKEEQLMDVCAKAESLLVEKCKGQTEGEVLLTIVKGFLETSHRVKSSSFLRSTTLSSLISSLSGEAVQEFCQVCMDCILGRQELVPKEKDKEGETKPAEVFRQQLVPLLRVAVLNPAMQRSDLTCRVLQFLFLHTFFKVFKATRDIPHCEEVSPDFPQSVRNACQATFYRTLTPLLSMKPDGHKEEQVLIYIRLLSDLAQFAQKLLSSPDIAQPVKDISEEVREEWATIMEIVNAKSQKRKSISSQLGEAETLTLLILHLAFDLFTQPEATIELLQDIYVCRQKAAKKQKAKHEDDGEPQWVEVVTEILLSMLSRASKLARKTVVAVFRSLTSHLTPAAVHLITEVLKSEKSNKKEELFEFEDVDTNVNNKSDEDSDKEDDDDDDDEDDKDEEMATDEDSDEDDDDEEEEDGEVDEELRRSVKAALGSAAVASDEEDEDEEEMSDEEMFKFDEQLAAAFRSLKRPTKKEKNEKRKEVASFRLRAFDLLEVVVKGDRCGDFAIELLEPLLRLVMLKFKGKQGEGQQPDAQQLCGRATELFHVLCKQRNMADHIHSKEELLEATTTLLQLAHSGSHPQLATEIANGCLCIMRLLSHQPDPGPSPVKTRAKRESDRKESPPSAQDGQDLFLKTIQTALEEDLVNRKNCKYNMTFFTAMVQKYPTVFWPLTDVVLTSLQKDDTKVYTKTQACLLLKQLVSSNKRDNLSEEQWRRFYTTVPPVLKKVILSQQKGALLNSKLLLEALTALFHISQMTTVEERKAVVSAELLSHLSSLKGVLNKDLRRVHNKLTCLLTKPQHKKKTAEKRKQQENVNEPQNGAPAKKRQKIQESGSTSQNGTVSA